MKLSVIVPAYNEEDTLEATVSKIDALLQVRHPGDYEIILVNDGSTDATLPRAKEIAASFESCRLLSYPRNRGKGHALKQGFALAQGRLVACIDADGEIDPQRLFPLLAHQGETGASIVVGRKTFVQDLRPWYRQAMTWGVKHVGHLFFRLPVSDAQSGLKLFVKEDVQNFVERCQENGYLFDLELLALAHHRGLSIIEIPVEYQLLRPNRITLGAGVGSVGSAMRLFLRWRVSRRGAPVARAPRSVPTSGPQGYPALTSLKVAEEGYDARP